MNTILNDEQLETEKPAGKKHILDIQSEPSGEIILGSLPDHEIEILKKMHGTDEYEDTDLFVFDYSNYNDLGHVYGIFSDVSSNCLYDNTEEIEISVEYNLVKSINIPVDDEYEPLDGFYIFYSGLSKMSLQLEIELPEGEEFDSNKITIDYTEVDLGHLIESEMYGEYSFSVLNEYYYDNKEIKDENGDDFEIIDRGLSNEFFIIQMKEGNSSIVFHLDSDGNSHWNDLL